MEDAEKEGRAIVDGLRERGLVPTLEQNDAYREAEAELLRARGAAPEDVEACLLYTSGTGAARRRV